MLGRSIEIWIAVVFLALGLIAAVLWVPLDSETPPIYTFRRQTYIGDAMLPMVAAAGIAICAALHLLLSWRRSRDAVDAPFDVLTGSFFLALFGIVAVSLLLMFWAGPAALALFGPTGEEPVTYRQMRSTLPWKYIGFVLGGFVLVFGITSLIEGKLSARRALSSILAVAVLILIFDVPFDTILLPPNGDF
ncbi:MAG: hypothetical protein AAFR47_18580 [Pseudomonadota bacterium]